MSTREANDALRLFGDLLGALPDPALIVGGDRRLLAINDAARGVIGGPAVLDRDLALSVRHPEILEAVGEVLAGAKPRRIRVAWPVPVLREFDAHVAGLHSAIVDGPAVFVILRDISAARAAERMRTDFVANVSHELRSPLSALIGFIETLEGPARDDPPAAARFLGIMRGEADRMARLLDDLLSLSKVEAQQHVQPQGAVDVAQVLSGVAAALGARAAAAGIDLRLSCAPDLPRVQGDRDELAEVFHNLIDNALKYGAGGTVVRVSAEDVGRIPDVGGPGVCVCVEDAGPGIPPEHLPRLTERFYRIDKGRSRDMGGTGLGLAIVKHIVNRHRGRLTAESTVGKGSRFKVFLPVAAEEQLSLS